MQYGQAGASKGGMPCTMCPHLGCQHSFLQQGVTPCPECEGGALVLDPLSAPKWRLDCNKCSFLIYLPDKLHSAKVTQGALCKVLDLHLPAFVSTPVLLREIDLQCV